MNFCAQLWLYHQKQAASLNNYKGILRLKKIVYHYYYQ